MLIEINSEKKCPFCGEDLHITGVVERFFLVHTCFKCKKTFINKKFGDRLK